MIPDVLPPIMPPNGMQGDIYDPKLPGQCLIVGIIALVFSLMFALCFIMSGFNALGYVLQNILVLIGALFGLLAIMTSIIGIVFSAITMNKIPPFGIRKQRTLAKVALFLSISAVGVTLLWIGVVFAILYLPGF